MPDENVTPSMPLSAAGGGGNTPRPDPTLLTTQQLLREISNVAELLRAEMKILRADFEGFVEVSNVRYESIKDQFAAIEAWRKEQKLDTKTAVDAALQAAEKAVREQTVASEKAITKSETSASEQSKQQYATFAASLKGVSDTLADVKDRVTKLESIKVGNIETRTNQQTNNGLVLAIAGFAVSLVLAAIVIYAAIPK